MTTNDRNLDTFSTSVLPIPKSSLRNGSDDSSLSAQARWDRSVQQTVAVPNQLSPADMRPRSGSSQGGRSHGKNKSVPDADPNPLSVTDMRPRTASSLSGHMKINREVLRERARPKAGFTLGEFCERIQIDGLIDWYNASSWLAKAFWLILIIAFSVILIINIVQSVREYYNNPIKTSISVMPMDSARIPDIYICPLNYINAHKVNASSELSEIRDGLWPYLARPRLRNLFNSAFEEWKRADPSMPLGGDVSKLRHRKVQTAEELRKNVLAISFNATEVIPRCEFESFLFDCSHMLTSLLDKEYGVCHKLSTNLKQSIPGLGLKILVDIHALNFDTDNIDSFFTGALVRFGEDANPLIIGGNLAKPGTYVRYGLEQQRHELITVKTSETPQICVEDDEIEFKYVDLEYSVLSCRLDCLLQTGYPICGCFPTIDATLLKPEWNRIEICNVTKFSSCILPILKREMEEQACGRKCYRKCISTKNRIQESSMLLGSHQLFEYFDILKDVFDDADMVPQAHPEYWEKSMILMEIAFDKMEYTSVVQSRAKSLVELIADLGGQVGLWLGASMFSLLQIVALFMSWGYTVAVNRAMGREANTPVQPGADGVKSSHSDGAF